MKKYSRILTTASFLFSLQVMGQGTEQATGKPADNSIASTEKDSIRNAAQDTQGNSKKGQVINYLTAATNFYQSKINLTKCTSSHGSNGYACAMAPVYFGMGVMNLKQASADGSSAGQAAQTSNQTDSGTDYPNGLGSGGGYDPEAVGRQEQSLREGQKLMDQMSRNEAPPESPFTYDKKTQTITTSTGKTFKTSDFSSPSSMAAAGIAKNIIDEATASQKKITAEAVKKAEKYKVAGTGAEAEEASSGGGGGGSSAKGLGADGTGGLAAHSGSGLSIDREPTQVAGMQKNYKGEPIGVAGDSIFNMMTRRYKVKESQRAFYDESDLLTQK